MKTIRGFTLYELVAVMAVSVILTSLMLPAYSKYALARRTEVTYDQFRDVVQFARAEAIRQNTKIYLCAANYNVNSVLSGCQGNGVTDWSEGVLAYIDYSGNGVYTSTERIKALQFDSHVSISVTPAVGQIMVNPDATLVDATGNTSWTFNLSQTIFATTFRAKVSLNQFGYATYCEVGTSGC